MYCLDFCNKKALRFCSKTLISHISPQRSEGNPPAFAGFPLALLAKKAKLDYDDTVPCDGSDTLGWAYALLGIMAQLDDNNALRRGGEEGAAYVKTTAGELFAAAPALPRGELRRRLIGLDSALTEKNLSCGGAADMLAAGIFLWEIEQEKYHACGLFEN